MKMLKMAVTGSAGSGKSLVCRRFNALGVAVLDCDVMARQVVEPGEEGYQKIVDLFGQKAVRQDGSLDRAKLRNMIVNDPVLRKKMEALLHPQILKKMISQMDAAGADPDVKAVAVEVPLLFESGMDKYFDITIAVIAKDPDLVKRIVERDRVPVEDARKMLDLQMSQEKKTARADYVILNTGTDTELFESVDNLFDRIQKEFLTT